MKYYRNPETHVIEIDWQRRAKRSGEWREDPYLRALWDPAHRTPYSSPHVTESDDD